MTCPEIPWFSLPRFINKFESACNATFLNANLFHMTSRLQDVGSLLATSTSFEPVNVGSGWLV